MVSSDRSKTVVSCLRKSLKKTPFPTFATKNQFDGRQLEPFFQFAKFIQKDSSKITKSISWEAAGDFTSICENRMDRWNQKDHLMSEGLEILQNDVLRRVS